MNLQTIKQRFGIIGNSQGLNRAIEVAYQVAATDLSVLITGESGTGKEAFPRIIHQFSARKHEAYIAVNCGAIPEGTIDSELFGHEKGSFTGAYEKRKGYFEVADGGTIFLDEVAELPLSTQVKLLRVLESGEFMKVGSSQVQTTNVRVVAATNVNIPEAISQAKFREDLFYRLNTVPIQVPPLRDRPEDIYLLFRKFTHDFSERYRMPSIRLSPEAQQLLTNYHWRGNIRQLKNIAEQISIIEKDRELTAERLKGYLPENKLTNLPAIYNGEGIDNKTFASEREILYQILFDMKKDMTELKKLVAEIMQNDTSRGHIENKYAGLVKKSYDDSLFANPVQPDYQINTDESQIEDTQEIVEESLLLEAKEKEMIIRALEKHHGKRKIAAQDLGISERTLYRKIKEYNI